MERMVLLQNQTSIVILTSYHILYICPQLANVQLTISTCLNNVLLTLPCKVLGVVYKTAKFIAKRVLHEL